MSNAKKTALTQEDKKRILNITKELRDLANTYTDLFQFTIEASAPGYMHARVVEVEDHTYHKYCHMSIDKFPFGDLEDNTASTNAYLKRENDLIEGRSIDGANAGLEKILVPEL